MLDDDDDDKDNNADNVAGVGWRTQGDRQNNPANRASDWRQETTPTKRPTESRLGATVRTLDDDGRVATNRPTMSQQAGGGAAGPTKMGW